ncbi:MAG: hypothetical protein IJO77_02025 [Oscillospiraceae bacterium]|nr:hypothetical protein [Oscillospiraceae bacterium]MBQ9857759.1 hypothetical protein [Oscillospiraceae bacterium]
MDSRKIVFKETAIIAVGEIICTAVMLGIFALVGKFDRSVILGGVFGCLLAILNFFFMAVGASLAADKAEKQDVKGGKGIVQTSMLLRYILLFVILFALGKSGICNLFALVIPLVFVRPVLTVGEFFRKKGDE